MQNLDQLDADIIFITVGTPSKRIEGEADLSFVWNVAEEISKNKNKYCIVVTKSTVPVGTTKKVKNIISKKIDEKTLQEEKELSKWLNKTESELKIVYGQPDKVEFLETRNRYYIYSSKKYNITCVRKFEVNPNNMIIGFTSKNCF